MTGPSYSPHDAFDGEEFQAASIALAEACRRLHSGGLLAGAEGNLSMRLRSGHLAVTPSGVDKARRWNDPSRRHDGRRDA
jgi:hypothetical protein